MRTGRPELGGEGYSGVGEGFPSRDSVAGGAVGGVDASAGFENVFTDAEGRLGDLVGERFGGRVRAGGRGGGVGFEGGGGAFDGGGGVAVVEVGPASGEDRGEGEEDAEEEGTEAAA